MVINLLVLAGVLLTAWLASRWLLRARPQTVARGLKTLGLAALVVLGLWLVLTGKLAGLLAVAAGLTPWISRAMRLHGLYRMLNRAGIRAKGGQAAAGNVSTVETRFLRMRLDHDSGVLDGEVIAGPFAGRALSALSFAEVTDLLRQAATDPQSLQVLEAWLDRTQPDWRDRLRPGSEAPSPAAGAMTRAEALEVLGLPADASEDEIKAAHRRLMRAAHPDHGGSGWIAARLNQARDVLLGP